MTDLLLLPVFAGMFAVTYLLEKRVGKARGSQVRAVALTTAVLAHPITLEVCKNFLVHIVVYSGYVIKLH